jgi:hypothetical protein
MSVYLIRSEFFKHGKDKSIYDFFLIYWTKIKPTNNYFIIYL